MEAPRVHCQDRVAEKNTVTRARQRHRNGVPKARWSPEAVTPRELVHGSPASAEDSVHLGRQPVFDSDLEVVGYELLFRRANANTAEVRDPEQATADVVVKTFADFGLDAVVGHKLAFVNLPRSFLTGRHPLPFAADRVVLEVLEDVVADTEVLDGMRRLRARGFRFALDDFVWSAGTEPLIELCDFVKLDVLMYSPVGLRAVVRRLRPTGVQLLAEKIETQDQLEACRALSFRYFQGYLLSRPTVLTRRSLDSTRIACLRLVAVLAKEEYDLAEIESAIRSDPGLTLRVLRAVNSAATGLRRKVSTVREAVLLLGPRTLMGWIMLFSMSGSDSGSNAVNVDVALTRARMCELLAPRLLTDADYAFTVGLVASLDLLLGIPLAEALAELPLDSAISAAVLDHEGPLGALLTDVLAYEARCPTKAVPLATARAAYLAALTWTRSVLAGVSE
jgi:c-di-GMP-related signal transduction protein